MAYPLPNQELIHQLSLLEEHYHHFDVIPHTWYQSLVDSRNLPKTTAILLLAEIVQWYRLVPIYDIQTKQIISYQKKFKSDLLQKSYKDFYLKFGFSKVQSRKALEFLEEKHLIFREFRDLKEGSIPLSNVMYIGIYPENIAKMSNSIIKKEFDSHPPVPEKMISSYAKNPTLIINSVGGSDQMMMTYTKITSEITQNLRKSEKSGRSLTFSKEENLFLNELLAIKPYQGSPIKENNATWWIKSFGIEAIKIALAVYWQRVNHALEHPDFEAPREIGACIRDALNKNTQVYQVGPYQTKQKPVLTQKDKAIEESQSIQPIDNQPLIYSKAVQKPAIPKVAEVKPSKLATVQLKHDQGLIPTPPQIVGSQTRQQSDKLHTSKSQVSKPSRPFMAFNEEEKKCLRYLLSYKPVQGEALCEKEATWWIKSFGVTKVKNALQVYAQQVDKASKNPTIAMPKSIGAYVRHALNKGLQPCRETDLSNKSFAERLKVQLHWSDLIITEKYCRVENTGKDWSYNMPESLFQMSLRQFYENYFAQERYA